MNFVKSLFFVGLLLAAVGGAVVSLYRPGDPPPPPPEAPQNTDEMAPPKVDLPSFDMQSMPGGSEASGSSGMSLPPIGSGVPPLPTSGNASPPPAATGTGDTVPPLAPPAGANPPAAAPANHGSSTIPPPPWSTSQDPPPASSAAAPASDARSQRDSLTLPSDHVDPHFGETVSSKLDEAQLEAVIREVQTKADDGRLAEALGLLTSLYRNPSVAPDRASQITHLLDQMAATVIYSRQHLLEPPYRVQPGDTLDKIAEIYSVPPELLSRINGIRDPQHLPVDQELKVIRGPFDAQINLDTRELTLLLNHHYAGRFPINLDPNHASIEGSYTVRDKRSDAFPRAGEQTAPGGLCIELDNRVNIRGPSDPRFAAPADGPIHLGKQDMDDVFGILSVGSRVVIQR